MSRFKTLTWVAGIKQFLNLIKVYFIYISNLHNFHPPASLFLSSKIYLKEYPNPIPTFQAPFSAAVFVL
ncbi:hypothetical protein SAMN02787100_2079 [Chryseobacterium sp. OV279]|nr:hypothetical protein SAMN02787100_2079 [Chryseobacterium sp. OV279]